MGARKKMSDYILRFDGSCQGQPDKKRIGMGIHLTWVNPCEEDEEDLVYARGWNNIKRRATTKNTNNVAEYEALIHGLEIFALVQNSSEYARLHIYGDSKLVINQVFANWKVNSLHLKSLNNIAKGLVRRIGLEYITAEWIPREENKLADKYAQNAASYYPETFEKNKLGE
jgi:ribonuclease HI